METTTATSAAMLRTEALRHSPSAHGCRPGGPEPWGPCSRGLAGVVVGALLLGSGGLHRDAQAQGLAPPPAPPPAPVDLSPATAPSLAADPAVQALVAEASRACRTALQGRFSASAEQLEIWLVPTQAIAIENGDATLPLLRRQGLDFGWMVRGRPDPLPIGVCRTHGDGAVAGIQEQKE